MCVDFRDDVNKALKCGCTARLKQSSVVVFLFVERRRKPTVGVSWRRFQTDILGWPFNTSYGDHTTMIGWQARGLVFSVVSIWRKHCTFPSKRWLHSPSFRQSLSQATADSSPSLLPKWP